MSSRVCATRRWKSTHPVAPSPSRGPSAPAEPLFRGSIHLADLRFDVGGRTVAVAPADLAIVQEYLQLVTEPIQAYATQYGAATLTAGSPLAPQTVFAPAGSYTDSDLQRWVAAAAEAASLGNDAAVLVLNPPGVVNQDAKESGGVGVLGYHGLGAVPYCFVNALGTGLTVPDLEDAFAEAVSHELAEMTVDPRADGKNPEVCDGCGTNCQSTSAFRAYFDASGAYLGTSTTFPPGFAYRFFISAIARPAHAADCPAPSTACAYPPPVVDSAGGPAHR